MLRQLFPVIAADVTLCNTFRLTYIPLQLLISPAKRRSCAPLSHEPFICELLLSTSIGKCSINKFNIIRGWGGYYFLTFALTFMTGVISESVFLIK